MFVVEASSWEPVFQKILPLDQDDFQWGSVRSKAQRVVPSEYRIDENCCAFLSGFYYTQRRLAIRFHDKGDILYGDEVTKKDVHRDENLAHFWKFLTSRSFFRWPMDSTPVVELRTNSFMFSWDSTPTPNETGSVNESLLRAEMSLMNANDLDGPDLVAFLQLLTYGDDSSLANSFVRLYGDEFCKCQESTLYDDYDNVIAEHPDVKKSKWKRKFLFFKDGDELPLLQIPDHKTVIVFHREGVSLEIEGKRIKVITNESYSEESEWRAPRKPDALQKSFTTAMRVRTNFNIRSQTANGTAEVLEV